MPTILVDTGVWIALCDPSDTAVPPQVAHALEQRIVQHRVTVPWPIAYETLRSRFVKKPIALKNFERELSSPRVVKIDDGTYREEALALSFESSLRKRRPLAMVDCMLRLVLEDPNTNVQYLATFNVRDFYDVCARKRIEIWPGGP